MGKMDFKKNTFLWIFVGIGILILIALIISSFVMYSKLVSVSNDVQNKLDEANTLISEVNKNIDEIKEVNSQIQELKEQNSDINKRLDNLSKKYPPSQTLNFNNIDQNQLNEAINSKIDVRFKETNDIVQFNFWFNIVVGSILSLGGLSLALYFVFRRKEK